MSRWMCSMSSPTARSRSIFWAAMRGSISKPTRSETWLWYCASKNPPIQSATFNSILKVEHAQHEETMTHSTLQRIFSVLNYKSRCEKVSGSMSSLVCQQFDNDVNEDIITFNMFKAWCWGTWGTEAFCQRYAEQYRPATDDDKAPSSKNVFS